MMAGHGARVGYSLGTNVNSPIFHVPTLNFGHGAGAYACTKWLPGRCIHTVFSSGAVHCFYSLLSSCFKMTSGRAKWSNYELSHLSGTQGVNAAPVSASTKVLVPEHQVWAVPYFNMKGFAL